MNLTKTQVLIIGAGPAGMSLACQLLRRGISCRILDKAPTFGTTSRAIGIQARTLEVFDNLGMLDGILERGVKGAGVKIYEGNKTLLQMIFRFKASDAIPHPYGLMLPQNDTEELLAQHLNHLGGQIERRRELLSLTQDTDGVTATVKNLNDDTIEQIRSDWLVGCDGAHSLVRKSSGIAFEGITYAEEFLLADVELDWQGDRSTAHTWLHAAGAFAAMPLPGGRWRLFADIAAPEGEVPPASVELFQRLLEERTGQRHITISNPVWMSNFRINKRLAAHYRQGRIFLIGDAAHVHSPFGGQGMNTGIQDAANLGWKLALVVKNRAHAALLDTYEEERRPIAQAVLNSTHRNTRIFYSKHPVLRFLRDWAVIPLLNTSFVQEKFMWEVSELGVNYRETSLSQNHAPRKGIFSRLSKTIAAGERAPDGICTDAATGQPTTLFEQFRGNAGHLLVFAGGENSSHAADFANRLAKKLPGEVKIHLVTTMAANSSWQGSTLLDTGGKLHRRYMGKGAALCLVRPDGYVGFTSPALDETALLSYLVTIFAPDLAQADDARSINLPALELDQSFV